MDELDAMEAAMLREELEDLMEGTFENTIKPNKKTGIVIAIVGGLVVFSGAILFGLHERRKKRQEDQENQTKE